MGEIEVNISPPLDDVVRAVPVMIFNEHGMRLQEFPERLVISEYSPRDLLCQHLSRIDKIIAQPCLGIKNIFWEGFNKSSFRYE